MPQNLTGQQHELSQQLWGHQDLPARPSCVPFLNARAAVQTVLQQTAEHYRDKLEWELYQARSQQAAELSTADFLRSTELADLSDRVTQLQAAGRSTVRRCKLRSADYCVRMYADYLVQLRPVDCDADFG